MAAYIAIFLSLVSILLLSIVLIRIKVKFSTEEIIKKSRIHMERLVQSLNNNAELDLNLLKEASTNLRNLLAEADKKMEEYELATERLRNMIAEVERLESRIQSPVVHYEENKNVANIKTVSQRNKEILEKRYNENKRVDPDAAYGIKKTGQLSLFDDDYTNTSSVLKDETKVTIDGAAYKEVPLIITNIYQDEPKKNTEVAKLSVSNKQSLSQQVIELYNQGVEIEEISKQLMCSVTEVQLIIDMF